MTTKHAAFATSTMRAMVLALSLVGLWTQPGVAAWETPWKDEERALVIDAYEFNPIDWRKMTSDERIAGFINKASDGLPPQYRCGSKDGDDWKLCTNRWWRYSVTKELYMTRRQMADALGLLWGAYHLARPGNPREQADHFLRFAEPRENDLVALDIEDLSDEFMSLEDAEIFADQIKKRIGRYPVLYTNGNTAKFISDNREDYPILSRLPLWYARYAGDISGKFPEETWPGYALWQFSSMHNCNPRSCPYRVGGTKDDIDVNVSTLDVAGLKAAWPFDELHDLPTPRADPSMLVAARGASEEEGGASGLLAAYGPASRHAPIDPLELLKETALERSPRVESRAKKLIENGAAVWDEQDASIGEPAPGMPVPKDNPRRPVVVVEKDEPTRKAEKTLGNPRQASAEDERGTRQAPVAAGETTDMRREAASEPSDEAEPEVGIEGAKPERDASVDAIGAKVSFAAFRSGDQRIAEAFSLTN